MKKHNILFVSILIFSFVSKAQLKTGTYNDYFREGSFLMQEENFDQALKNFIEAYKIDSSSANINFNVGYCLLNSSNKKATAEKYLAKAIIGISKNYRSDDPSEKESPPIALFYFARALHNNYKFDEANAQYELFETYYVKDKKQKEEIEYYRAQNAFAKEIVSTPINVTIQNLGDSINSEYPDFSPVLSADERTIIYTTRRNTSTGGEKAFDGQYYEDIVIAYKDENGKWSSPKPISKYINTDGNEASINLTPDGQTLIVYQDLGSGNGGDIYFSTWDGKDWSSLQQFGSDINTKYFESHGCLTADNNTLYFVSNRPGGFGGRDIYRCVKLPNGKWSKASNLGPTINTKYDEDGPFIHPDGITLIFASKGHKTIGGFDIFFSTVDEERKFSQPENMGYPINTTDDDVFFVTSPDGKRGYFSSDKAGGFGEKDIYTMFITDAKEKPLALFKGSIIPANDEELPEDIMVVVTDKETGEVIGNYRPNENGTFSTILPPNRNYVFSYQSKGEEFYNEELYVSNEVAYQEIKKEINLEPISLLGKVKVKDKLVVFTILVLNNPIDKKPLPNANITLTEKGGSDIIFKVDGNGKKESTPLVFDKLYSVVAELNGEKSIPSTFNTFGIKGSKSITQIIYLEGKATKEFDLFLNIIVLNAKRKPIANTKIKLVGSDGSNYEGITDEKGRIKNLKLNKNVKYEVIGESNGNVSKKETFNTFKIKLKKIYEKTLVIDSSPIISNNTTHEEKDYACGISVNFKRYFSYDRNETKEEKEWINLIDGIVAKTKECNPNVKILSSASQVPTRKYSSNKLLAKSRAEKMEAKIRETVTAKGGDASKINFKLMYEVRGPMYEADYKNVKKYGKYQYVKVIAR